MRSSSSNRLRSLPLIALPIGLMCLSCAIGLDFDELSNECADPNFDLSGTDRFCAGTITRLATFEPSLFAELGRGRTLVRLDRQGDLIAMAGLAGTSVTAQPGCDVLTVTLVLARLGDDGSVTEIGSVNGAEYGLFFVVSDDGQTCVSQNADLVWPFQVEIVDTSPIRALAVFGGGGLLSVQFDESGRATRVHHVAGAAGAPTARGCSLGACVTPADGYCNGHADCAADSFCNQLGRCQAVDQCLTGLICQEPSDRCVTRRGVCAIECSTHLDCPHPLLCAGNICGGPGCALEAVCPSDFECVEGTCTHTCNPEQQDCPEGLICFGQGQAGLCSAGGAAGLCASDDDCALGSATGFAVLPASPLTLGSSGLILANATPIPRLAVEHPRGDPYFFPPTSSASTSTNVGDIIDLVYDGARQAGYATLSSYGVARLDLSVLETFEDLENETYISSRQLDDISAPLGELFIVDDYLVVIEGGLFGSGEAPFETRARILSLDSEPALEELARIELGDALQVTADLYDPLEDVWIWGVDRQAGAEVLFYDMRDPRHPALLSSVPLGPVEGALERHFAMVSGSEVFLGTSAGLTRYRLAFDGELVSEP